MATAARAAWLSCSAVHSVASAELLKAPPCDLAKHPHTRSSYGALGGDQPACFPLSPGTSAKTCERSLHPISQQGFGPSGGAASTSPPQAGLGQRRARMSVAPLHSPAYLGSKRFLEEEEGRLPLTELKRARQQAVSPGGRCADTQAYTVGHSTVAALRALFPEMNDKVIANVLAEYGNNIDAAIKHLNDLRLSGAQGDQRGEAGLGGTAEPAAAEAAQQQQEQRHAAASREPAGAAEPAGGAVPAAKTAAEWVDLVVRQMAGATSVDNAKQRAASILQAFEQAAVQHAKQQVGGGEQERLKLQVQELAKENQLLKRAVTIQNARMQELGSKEQEVQQLRAMLEGYQQKVHSLEVQNYSLALHLKQATDSRDPLRSHKNPDVF